MSARAGGWAFAAACGMMDGGKRPIRKGEMGMDVQVGDILTMKKPHPCGAKQWKVLRTGMDFKLKCEGCGHEVMLPRSKAEKNIRTIEREGKTVC